VKKTTMPRSVETMWLSSGQSQTTADALDFHLQLSWKHIKAGAALPLPDLNIAQIPSEQVAAWKMGKQVART
jgi:hypothetical protein